jgi:hypothetical protein
MQHFLERAGFEVVPALGGRKGLETFRARPDEIDAVCSTWPCPSSAGKRSSSR